MNAPFSKEYLVACSSTVCLLRQWRYCLQNLFCLHRSQWRWSKSQRCKQIEKLTKLTDKTSIQSLLLFQRQSESLDILCRRTTRENKGNFYVNYFSIKISEKKGYFLHLLTVKLNKLLLVAKLVRRCKKKLTFWKKFTQNFFFSNEDEINFTQAKKKEHREILSFLEMFFFVI